MKRLYTSTIALFCALTIWAQPPSEDYQIVRETLDEMFENLDKTKVPTGLLLDYAVDLVEFSDYDGTELTDSNLVNTAIYNDILRSIRSSAVVTAPFGDVENLMESFQGISGSVGISFAAFKYNFIKANALTDNLLEYDENTGQVSDVYVNGVWQNPYSENMIFAFAPNASVCNSLSVTYSFPATFQFLNVNLSEAYFDAGDGQGYRSVISTTSTSITYTNYGTKTLKLKVRTTEGRLLEAHSTINIQNLSDSNSGLQGGVLPPDNTQTFTTSYNGLSVSAQMSCYFKTGGSSVTKPFIVVEGFDPWILEYITGNIPNETIHLGFTTHEGFYEDCWINMTLKDEYDLIYIDWDNSLADIRANAQLLVQIIQTINQMKAASGSTEKNIVMGQSMGGLIARYALRYMEVNDIEHDTSTYISHDSPHLGANVPLGALYFVQQVMSFALGESTICNLVDLFTNNQLSTAMYRFCSVLYADSVKQMLVNHVGNLGTIDNSTHQMWKQTLGNYGLPTQTENLAIVNGRHFDREPTLVDGNHLLYLNGYAKTTLLADIIGPFMSLCLPILPFALDSFGGIVLPLGSSKISIDGIVNPLSATYSGETLSKLKITFTKKFLWLFDYSFDIFSSEIKVPLSGFYYDDYPGSIYKLSDDIYETTLSFSNALAEMNVDLGLGNKIMFIPTASALAIRNGGNLNASHYTTDYFTNPPDSGSETPFDAYFLSDKAENHIHLSDTIYTWLEQQLSVSIEAPDTLMTSSATCTLAGYSGNVQWKSSDNTIAVVDNNGVITPTGNGIVTITAETYNNGAMIRKTKRIIVGFPDIAIAYSFSPGNGHQFTATTPDSENFSALHALVQSGYLRYEWTVLCDEEDRVTTVTTTPSVYHKPKQDETVTVCLRLVDNNGRKGATYSRTVNLKNPFLTNYQYVEIDSNGTVKFMKANGYEVGIPSSDFTVTFRNIIYTSNENLFELVSKYLKGNMCFLAYRTMISTVYMQGTRVNLQTQWTFPFFDNNVFLYALEDAIYYATEGMANSGTIRDFGLFICNAEREFMQALPFAIIYKP